MKIQTKINQIILADSFLFQLIRLIAIEIALTGCAIFITGYQLSVNYLEHGSSYLLFNIVVFLFGILLFVFSFFLSDRLKSMLLIYSRSKALPWIVLAGILIVAVGTAMSGSYFSRIMPLAVCAWVIGLELILYSSIRVEQVEQNNSAEPVKLWKVVLVIFLFVVVLGLPSNLQGCFDGVPFDHKAEFIAIAALLPFLLVLDKKVFLSRMSIVSIFVLFILKLVLVLSPANHGLNLWVYQTPEAMEQDRWTPSYETNFFPETTTLMKSSYTETYQFPIEWFNTHSEDMDGIWVGIRVDGYVQLAEDEQLLINTRDARSVNLGMTDVSNGRIVQADSMDENNNIVWDHSFSPGIWHITGTLSYQYGHFTFRPLIQSAVGEKDAFSMGRIWQDAASASMQKTTYSFYKLITGLFDVVVFILLGMMIVLGVLNKYRTGELSYIELYFFPTAILLFVIALHFDQQICRLIALSMLTLTAAIEMLFSGMMKKSSNMLYRWLLLISIVVISIFASMDFLALSNVTAFPQGQDNMTYQMEARLIYVVHDYFLLTQSPRAYKLVFPYVVGFLHLLFGHSSAAQFLLNAWAFIFTTWIIARIIKLITKNGNYALFFVWLTQMVYLSLLFYKNYFRYGLIEPLSTLILFLVIYKLYQKQWGTAILFGMILSVLRMDYAGALLISPILIDGAWTGPWKDILTNVLKYIKKYWKAYCGYAISLVILPIVMTAFYYIKVPNYILNASDTVQTSVFSVMEGLIRLVDGGTFEEVAAWIRQYPLSLLLMWAVSISGFVLAILTVLRIKSFKKQNIQWALIYFGLTVVYVVVRPTGYSPRFSTPFIPLAIIMLALYLFSRKNNEHIPIDN